MSEIVGIVPRMRFHPIDEMAPLPVIYCPMAQAQRTSISLFVRSGIHPVVLAKSIRDVVSSIDPSQPVFDARPMLDRVRDTWGTQRLLSFLVSIFAGLALLLATIGLYGLLAYTTLKRVREIGIRVALGARPAQIRALILSHGMQLLLMGSVIGSGWRLCTFTRVAKRAFRSQRNRSRNLSRRWADTFQRNAPGSLDSSAPRVTRGSDCGATH